MAAFGKDIATQARLTEASGTVFANIRTVRSFGAEGPSLQGFAALANGAKESGMGIGRVKSLLECANRGSISISLFTLYAYGGWLCRCGIVPVGTMLASVGYTFLLIFGCTVGARQRHPRFSRIPACCKMCSVWLERVRGRVSLAWLAFTLFAHPSLFILHFHIHPLFS